MANNYDEYNYEDSDIEKKAVAKKRLLIALLIVIAIILVIVLLKSCGKGGNNNPINPNQPETFDYEKSLLEAGKSYYNNNDYLLPTSIGECKKVELSILIEKGLLNKDDFNKCDDVETYVMVCKLENGNLQWVPWLSCTDKNSDSEYDVEKEGTESDLVTDESFISFRFLPQKLNETTTSYGEIETYWKDEIPYKTYKTISSTKNYRYRDLEYIWNLIVKTYYTSKGDKTKESDVNEYYVTSPATGYTNKTSKTDVAYKWFTSESTKVFLLESNGKRVVTKTTTAPNAEYPYYNKTQVYFYVKRTATGTYQPALYNRCVDPKYPTYQYLTTEACGTYPNTSYTQNKGTFWSCAIDDQDVTDNIVKEGTLCKKYTDWELSNSSCTPSDTCEKRVKNYYEWYKLTESGRTYIPSGSTNADGEKTYYIEAPSKSAIRDNSTRATAYKWYKETKSESSKYYAESPSEGATKTSKSKWSDWSSWSTKAPSSLTHGGTRKIESKYKIKLKEIKGTTDGSWVDLSTSYVTEGEMLNIFQEEGFEVTTLEDVNNNGDIRYKVKMLIRNKKEVSNNG